MLTSEQTGRLALRRVLRAMTHARAAALCGVERATVTQWANGRREPTQANRRALERLGIDCGLPW